MKNQSFKDMLKLAIAHGAEQHAKYEQQNADHEDYCEYIRDNCHFLDAIDEAIQFLQKYYDELK